MESCPSNPRTLVIHTGGIGDFLLACPALKRLAASGPLELAGQRDRLSLAVGSGIAEAAHDLDAVGFASVFSAPSDAFRAFAQRFTKAVVWMRDDGVIANAFTEAGLPDVQTFPGLPPDDWREHASRYYLSCIRETEAPPLKLEFTPHAESLDFVSHPGSGGTQKNWPFERFLALADILESSGRRITWCRGPAEEALPLPPSADILETGSLTDLARRMAAARAYIGNDSGITHLAAAVGCPTIAIFGPTDPAVWAPSGERVHVVHGAPWPEINAVLHRLGLG